MRGKATDGEPDWVSANRRWRRLTAVNEAAVLLHRFRHAVEGCRPSLIAADPLLKPSRNCWPRLGALSGPDGMSAQLSVLQVVAAEP